jgi:hypothetical protein
MIRVGQPPFAFRIEGPDDWMLLETAPSTWKRSVERLLADRAVELGRLPAGQRRQLMTLLEDMVAAAQQTGVVLSLVKLARDASDRLFCGSLALSWYDAAPVPADLAFARLAAGDAGRVEELDTPAGPALLRRETLPRPIPATELFGDTMTHSAQAFLPVPGTSWTALVTGTVGRADHAGLLDRLVGRMAGSLRVQRQPPGLRLQ